jgi:hypothetical protein
MHGFSLAALNDVNLRLLKQNAVVSDSPGVARGEQMEKIPKMLSRIFQSRCKRGMFDSKFDSTEL